MASTSEILRVYEKIIIFLVRRVVAPLFVIGGLALGLYNVFALMGLAGLQTESDTPSTLIGIVLPLMLANFGRLLYGMKEIYPEASDFRRVRQFSRYGRFILIHVLAPVGALFVALHFV